MPKIEHQRTANFPAAAFESALVEVLRGIETQEGPWSGFTFHVGIRDVGLPDIGYIAVPISLRCAPEPNDAEQFQMTFHVEAQKNRGAFPIFDGHCGVTSINAMRCNFWISGVYTVPITSFGIFFDATLLHGVADRAVAHFAEDIVMACDATLNHEEQQYLRYHLMEHA